MLPSLSRDVWSQIATHLPPTDLKSLSETSVTIYQAVTTDQQFRLRVSVSDQEKRSYPWRKMYRRFSALQHAPVPGAFLTRVGRPRPPPKNDFPAVSDNLVADSFIHIVGTVGDSLLLYDGMLGRLVGFPYGWSRYISRQMSERCIMVGNGCVAVLHGTEDTIDAIECIQVKDGKCVQCVTVESDILTASSEFSRGRMRRPVVAVSAGQLGDHIALVRDGVITVVRLRDAYVVRVWEMGDEWRGFSSLVRGEDSGWCGGEGDGGERVVALLRRRIVYGQRTNEYDIIDVVDGSLWSSFHVDVREQIVDVVVSEDRQWTGRRIVLDGRRSIMWGSGPPEDGAAREVREDVGWTSATFGLASCEFSIGRGGREMRVNPMGTGEVAGVEGDGRVSRVFYGETDVCVHSLNGVRRISGCPFDWATVSGDGRTLLACCKSIGVVSVFDLDGGRSWRSLRCKESIREICLVGQHWLVVVGTSGAIHQAHFGRWCNTAPGRTEAGSTDKGETHSVCDELFAKWGEVFGTLADGESAGTR